MSKGRYGIHGGQYISETLMNELIRLEESYEFYKNDPEFNAELDQLLKEYAGRPSLLYYAEKMTKDLGGAKIYLKREDLNHTGSHKINNVLGQVLMAKRWARPVSSLRPERDSTALRRPPRLRFWAWNVKCLWGRRIRTARRSMYTGWSF